MKTLKNSFHSFRYNLLPKYKGHPVDLEKAYSMYKKLMPVGWELFLSENSESYINYETRTIELAKDNWTEEIVLHSIGTIVIFLIKNSALGRIKYENRSKIEVEIELWEWVKRNCTSWDFHSKILRMRTLDWYKAIPYNSFRYEHAFGIELK